MDAVRRRRLSVWPIALSVVLLPASRHAGECSRRPMPLRRSMPLVRATWPQVQLPVIADDQAFLRRVALDLTGKLPEPDALRSFVADTARRQAGQADRRAAARATPTRSTGAATGATRSPTTRRPAATTSAGSCSTTGGPTSSAAIGRGTRSSRPSSPPAASTTRSPRSTT